MGELIDKIRAAIDEDERAARAWLPLGNPDDAAREHIARHDLARVLRQVAAHRLILDLHEHVPVEQGGIGCVLCAYDTKYGEIVNGGHCGTVLALAEAYGIEVDE